MRRTSPSCPTPSPLPPSPPQRAGPQATQALRPRDAATLVIVDRSAPTPRVLMGRRHPGQVFLPDTFVFPGGRVEPADRALARRLALPPREAERLSYAVHGRPTDARAAALALAAIRETFEETGFVLGTPASGPPSAAPGAWLDFMRAGHHPRLDGLTFFARAITPPGRTRRYDTRFFLTDAAAVTHCPGNLDGELLDIDWFTLDEARRLNLPSITHHVLEDVAKLLARPAKRLAARDVPFYRHRYGRFERTLLRPPEQNGR
ncbi:NUDIX hydrolase [Hyphomicrobium nitrativorans NL23]|uniref:NUDIX hydrolase n=1 Tax=Hyphomicrobium nitrativorans NL23 TaxID=1029756 RepID=V5SFE2_9HYPH|nr:NUDIX hydrolase [Hyphomicrobium nitrativorans NL23]